jgi:tRNA A37 threonylcarbamoyladenosine dehydratase
MPNPRNSRQSFLGPRLEEALARTRIAVIGLSGGGSHVVQQLAHIGFQRYVLFDPQTIDDTNIHRLVGATIGDVAVAVPKVAIAERVIRNVLPQALVEPVQGLWQDNAQQLRSCDIIVGCVDTHVAHTYAGVGVDWRPRI